MNSASSLAALLGSIFLSIAILIVGAWFLINRKGSMELGGNTIVRCRSGHLFTTIWVPGISFKAIRLGATRFQYCPVGGHWTFVVPINESVLTDKERQFAHQNHDQQIP
jgi:hypothetical protein